MSELTTLAALTPDPANARRHTPRNVGTIVDSLHAVGAARSIVIDEAGVILAGNATVEAAAQAGIERVQVVETDGETLIAVRRVGLTAAQKTRLALADNRSAELAAWDTDVLATLATDTPDLLAGLWHEDELSELLAGMADPILSGGGGDDFDTTPADGPTRVQPGDVWAIGPHRLVCGDSTRADQVAALFGDARAEMIWTDPPYGVDIVGGTHDPNRPTYQSGNRIANDNLSDSELEELLRAALGNAWTVCAPGGAWYVAAPAGPLHHTFGTVLKELGVWRQTLNWVKHAFVFGRSDYHYRHEPIFYGWKEGAAHYFTSDRTQDTIWEYDRPGPTDKAHPTVKPLELVTRAIENSSTAKQIVYDPFLGSGTTLIAAHRTGRVCYGVELEPRYGDVILRRAEAEGIGPIVRLGAADA